MESGKQFEKTLFGHRGAVGTHPENTLEAFRQALADGATALELDVHQTVDNKLAVIHDPTGARVARKPQSIRKTKWDEISSWKLLAPNDDTNTTYHIPLLNDVLEAFPNTPLNIDIKTTGFPCVKLVVDLIRQQRAVDRCRLGSFSTQTVNFIHDYGYEGEVALSKSELLRFFLMPTNTLKYSIRGNAAQVPLRHGPLFFGNRWFIKKCHDLNLRVDFWVINEVQTAKILLSKGADGIITDSPASLLQVYTRAANSEPSNHQ